MAFSLEQIDDWWRFHNQPFGGAASLDFQLTAADDALFERQCEWLQTSAESGFVQNSVCQRYYNNELSILRGRVLKVIRADGVEQRTVATPDEYRDALQRRFAIHLPDVDVATLWQNVSDRHAVWLRQQATLNAESD